MLYINVRAVHNHTDLWLLALGRHRTMMTIRMTEKRRCQKASSTHSSRQSWNKHVMHHRMHLCSEFQVWRFPLIQYNTGSSLFANCYMLDVNPHTSILTYLETFGHAVLSDRPDHESYGSCNRKVNTDDQSQQSRHTATPV